MNKTRKTSIKIILMVSLLIILTGVTAFANSDVLLFVDGERVDTDVPPMITQGTTLAPFRAMIEKMGGTVYWEEKASLVTAVLGNSKIHLTVNSKTAFVNGIRHELLVAPIIKDGSTLIPVRFVSENLGGKVDWDGNTRSVLIESPPKHLANKIESIKYEDKDGAYRITVTGIDENSQITSFSYDSPERFGIDIKDSVLAQGIGSINVSNPIISKVRFSQFVKETDNEIVRIVVDLKEKVAGRLSFSEDGSQLFIDFGKTISSDSKLDENPGDENPDEDNPGNEGDQPSDEKDLAKGLPELDWKAKGKLVVLDPGHGGRDPGAVGKIDGQTVLVEKELNLEIALMVNQLLKEAGANVMMLRETDVWMELYERPEKANKLKADLLVGIHNNGYDSSTLPNGVEVLYYDKPGTENYGVSSNKLARFIQDELYVRTGLQNRGIKSSPHLAVLNKSLMPAVIIEGGFLSNPDDLAVMLKDEYKEGYAMAAAIGIIEALNYWVAQEN